MDKEGSLLEKRKIKLKDLRTQDIPLFPNDFRVQHTVQEIRDAIDDPAIAVDEASPVFVVAGRMMASNHFGKTAFIRFKDRTGQLQAYIRKDRIGEAAFRVFKQLDIGDFLGLA